MLVSAQETTEVLAPVVGTGVLEGVVPGVACVGLVRSAMLSRNKLSSTTAGENDIPSAKNNCLVGSLWLAPHILQCSVSGVLSDCCIQMLLCNTPSLESHSSDQ